MPSACLIHFNLSTNEIGLSDLRQWAQPNQGEKPWYSILTSTTRNSPSLLGSLRAVGKLSANRLLVQHLVATQVSANVSLDAGKLKVSDLRADFLGGTQRGEWQADFTRKLPVYAGSGTLSQVSMNGIADAMNDSWISGVADGKYQLTASGLSSEDFWRSADAVIQFEIRDGVLPHLSLANDDDPLKINRFAGRAHLQEGTIEIKDGDLDSPSGAFQVSGTASLSRELDFKLKPTAGENSAATGQHAYTITGTLAQPQAVATSGPETPGET